MLDSLSDFPGGNTEGLVACCVDVGATLELPLVDLFLKYHHTTIPAMISMTPPPTSKPISKLDPELDLGSDEILVELVNGPLPGIHFPLESWTNPPKHVEQVLSALQDPQLGEQNIHFLAVASKKVPVMHLVHAVSEHSRHPS